MTKAAFWLWAVTLGCPSFLTAQQATPVETRFLSAQEAASAILDESVEPYFSILQPLEILAKTGRPLTATDLPAQRDECRKRYRESVREFTEDEKTALTATTDAIRSALKNEYPLFARTPWSFLKVAGSIEGGLPHTRGAHIVFSERLAAQFAAVRSKGIDPSRTGLGELLIHEQCHVVERAHPALFPDLYTGLWGLLRAKGLPATPWLEKYQIVNPDGPDVGWVFPERDGATVRYWQPNVLLKEGVDRPRMPRDFLLVGIALEKKGDSFVPREGKDGRAELKPLDEIPAWQAVFGKVPENFHPNETFAVLFSWLAMQDHIAATGPGLEKHDVDFTKFREWCRKNFSKKD
jgi:hypothetical protein